MQDFRRTLAKLEQNADGIAAKVAALWHERAQQVLDERLPLELDLDHLPEVIRRLAAAATAGAADRAAEQLIRSGIEHGKHRREAGYSGAIIFREYHVLRRFLWDELKGSGEPQDAIVGAILHIDAAMTTATAASIHGFHLLDRPMDEDALVQRLVNEWTTPFD